MSNPDKHGEGPTPRTDEAAVRIRRITVAPVEAALDVARQLERELAERDEECLLLSAQVKSLDSKCAEYEAQRPSLVAPEGWQLVPKVPTEQMLNSGAKFSLTLKDAYKDMLRVAPTPPSFKVVASNHAVPQEAIDLLQEGATGFGKILISTSDDKSVRNWQKRCKAFLATVITGAG